MTPPVAWSREDRQAARGRKTVIVFVLSSLEGGGAERVTSLLLRYLDRSVFAPTLILFQRRGEYLADVPPDVAVVDLGKQTRWDCVRVVTALRRWLAREQPDVIVSMLDYANIVTVLAALPLRHRCRVIISERNYPPQYLPRRRWSTIRRLLMAWTYRRAQTVIAVSRGIADVLTVDFGVRPDRIKVSSNPVDIRTIQALREVPVSHAFFDHAERRLVLLAVGRLTRQKNLALLIRALAMVRQTLPATLIVLGQGELRNELEALARQLGVADAVEFVGFQRNPFAWMRRADVVVSSSDWEGWCNVIAEAMACGTPVIATNCPTGPAELIEHGRSGLLVPVGDANALSGAILELAKHPSLREQFRQEAWRRIERFDVAKMVAGYAEIFRGAPTT